MPQMAVGHYDMRRYETLSQHQWHNVLRLLHPESANCAGEVKVGDRSCGPRKLY